MSAPGLFALRLDDELAVALYERRHVDALFALVDANREHLARFMPWAHDSNPDETAAFVERSLAEFARGEGFQGGLFYRGELIGGVGTPNFDRANAKTELGYWLGAEAEGRGLMGRAVAALVRYLFEEHAMNRIEIRAQSDNHRSRAIPERLGFTQEGTLRQVVNEGGVWRDHVVYSLLRSEWQQRQEEA